MFPRTALVSLAAGALLALGAGCKSTDDATSDKPGKYDETVVRQQVQTVTATVVSVDQRTREVVLRGEDGETTTIVAGEEVRNLPQVKAGDKVKVNYYERVAGRILRPGEAAPAAEQQVDVGRAPQGEQPGAFARKQTTVTATVTGVDLNTPSITLKRPSGDTATVLVRDRERLKQVKVGEQVVITYVEGLAIAVEPAD